MKWVWHAVEVKTSITTLVRASRGTRMFDIFRGFLKFDCMNCFRQSVNFGSQDDRAIYGTDCASKPKKEREPQREPSPPMIPSFAFGFGNVTSKLQQFVLWPRKIGVFSERRNERETFREGHVITPRKTQQAGVVKRSKLGNIRR